MGPFSDNAEQQMGDYSPNIDPRYITTVRTGLSPLGSRVNVESGCSNTRCLNYNATSVQAAVRDADITFVCLGTGKFTCTFLQYGLELPCLQMNLLHSMRSSHLDRKPCMPDSSLKCYGQHRSRLNCIGVPD